MEVIDHNVELNSISDLKFDEMSTLTKNQDLNGLIIDFMSAIKQEDNVTQESLLSKLNDLKTEDCELISESLVKSPNFFYAIEWRLLESKIDKDSGRIYEWLFNWYSRESKTIEIFVASFIPIIIWLYLNKNTFNIVDYEIESFLLGLINRIQDDEIINIPRVKLTSSIYHNVKFEKAENLPRIVKSKPTEFAKANVTFSNRGSLIQNAIDQYVKLYGKLPIHSTHFFCMFTFQSTCNGYPFALKKSPYSSRTKITLPVFKVEDKKKEENSKQARRIFLTDSILQSFINGLSFAVLNQNTKTEALNSLKMIHNRAVYHVIPTILLSTNAILYSLLKNTQPSSSSVARNPRLPSISVSIEDNNIVSKDEKGKEEIDN